jgi:hypothetical protein
MNKKIVLFFVVLLSHYARSQNADLTRSDSIIFNAMHDEMNRSMKEYTHPEAGKFFYINYEIADGQTLSVLGELGCITQSDKRDYRSWSYRIMLGDYNCNDENFISSSQDYNSCLLYTSPSPRDRTRSRMPSAA